MNKSRRLLLKVGIAISMLGLCLFATANAADKTALKRVLNPYQQTLLKYKAKLNSTTAASRANQATLSPYIVGGADAKPAAYPWMTALLIAEIPNAYDAQFCGGSLIAPDVVVTAAHCLDILPGEEFVDVVVGAYDLSKVTADQRVKVRGFVIHPGYDESNLNNDIGIIKLDHPIDTVSLPLMDPQQMEQLLPGEMLTAIGFGSLYDSPLSFPSVLQEVQLGYVDKAVCNEVMSVVGGITETQICAGNSGQIQDSCYGDSGGPLMANINGEWRLTGIVSWGLGCGLPDYYGVYTEAADFVQWVADAADSLYLPGKSYFGYLSLGRKKRLQRTLDNWTGQALTISDVAIQDRGLGFAITKDTCSDHTLATGQTCDIEIEFEPSVPGRLLTQIVVTTTTGETASSLLYGAALGEINASRALDSRDLDWYSGPELNWMSVDMADAVNGSAMQAGAISDLQTSAILTYVYGPGTINFNWQVSSELDYDYLFLVVDGYIVDAVSGDSGWLSSSYDIVGSGEHAIMWAYNKDPYVSDGLDSAWLDNVSWHSQGNGGRGERIGDGSGSDGGGGLGGLSWLVSGIMLMALRRRLLR